MPSPLTAAPHPAISRPAVEDVAAILPGWVETVLRLHGQSGLQVALWHDGQLVTELAVGSADESAGIPLRTTHRLRIASHSKTFTALTVMRLKEQGRLRLDDTVGDHVAELTDSPVADRTLRDLLSHPAGLTRDSGDSRWWRLGTPFADRARLLEIARTGAVRAEAGLHLQYSNIGYGLLGLVIEEVTGMSFAEAVTELVLSPVGVEGLGPDLPAGAPGPEAPDGFARGHTSLLHGPRRVVEQIGTGALAAATGFWASAGTIASFAGKVLTQDALLEPGSLREMRRRVWTLHEGGQYGLGLQEGNLHGFAVIGHSGGFPTGLSRTWAAPAERLVVSVIGTSVDSPSSEVALGILGLLALAAGRPAPQAEDSERAGAQGGASNGRARPVALAEQEGVHLGSGGAGLSAEEVAALVEGTYESLWGRTRLVALGGRLFCLDEAATDPAQKPLELTVRGVGPDPYVPERQAIALSTWGDTGYGTWAEPIFACLADTGAGGPLRCEGLVVTGQLQAPSADFVMPERVTAP